MLLKWEAGKQADRKTNNQIWTSWTLIDGAFFSSITNMSIEKLCGGWGGFTPPGIWGFKKEDRNVQNNYISPLKFENLTTSLYCTLPARFCGRSRRNLVTMSAVWGHRITVCSSWQLMDISRAKTDHCGTLTGFWQFFWIVYVFDSIYRFPSPVQQNDRNLK